MDDCPACPNLATVKSPTSVALASDEKGNLSITLVKGLPPEVYPDAADDCPARRYLASVRSPTSVALASDAKGNLSITFEVGGVPPDV